VKRNLADLQQTEFDILIIGGGITGACLALDAVLRGLSVALVEKNDFGAATSSASSKLLHGGIRYLQQLNLKKVRESALERIYFQQLAPHLTSYIPFIIPTYSSFSKSRLVMRTAMILYEMLCAGHNRILSDPAKRVPDGRFISAREINDLIPGLSMKGITGGVGFYESHMHSSERMTLAILGTAQQHGAAIANYITAESFIGAKTGRIRGIRARDVIGDTGFDIRASLVINAAGPWIPVLNNSIQKGKQAEVIVSGYSKGVHIVTRSLTRGHAVALPTRQKIQAVFGRGGRHVFIIPWRDCSLIGTTYSPYDGDLDDVRANDTDVQEMLGHINSALGNDVLQRKDVLYAFAGLYPLVDDFIKPKVYQGTGKYQIVDHTVTDNLEGLVTVFGAKFTTARLVAEKTIDKVADRFSKPLGKCKTRQFRLVSGDFDNYMQYLDEKKICYGPVVGGATVEHLVINYGTGIDKVIKCIEEDPSHGEVLAVGRQVLAAEIIHAAREEMVCHLDDAVFRRTGLGTLGNPGVDVLRQCAQLLAKELGWNNERIEEEVKKTLTGFIKAEQQ
jgi:glycerol-3-phosphate dehydrogenase